MIKIKVKKSRLWVPAAGIVLAFGFFNNCVLLPWLHGGEPVDWTNLIFTLGILLGLGGARDVILRKYRYLGPVIEESIKSQSKGLWTNKIWIPIIGWCLVGGLFNNCCIHPFLNVGEVEWGGLLSALSIMLTISGVREWKIYEKDKEVLEKFGDDIEDAETDEQTDTEATAETLPKRSISAVTKNLTRKKMPPSQELSEV